jgi:hypothetical protein
MTNGIKWRGEFFHSLIKQKANFEEMFFIFDLLMKCEKTINADGRTLLYERLGLNQA